MIVRPRILHVSALVAAGLSAFAVRAAAQEVAAEDPQKVAEAAPATVPDAPAPIAPVAPAPVAPVTPGEAAANAEVAPDGMPLPQDVVEPAELQVPAPEVRRVAAPSAPVASGIDSWLPDTDFGRLFDGFTGSVAFTSIYDSNPRHASGGLLNPVSDDFIFVVAPQFKYANPGTEWTFTAGGGVSYAEYLDNSDLSGLSSNAMVGLAYDGGKVALETSLSMSQENGVSRIYDSALVERTLFSYGLRGTYRISPKTTIDSSIDYRWEDPNNGFAGSSNLSLGTAAMWRYSPLLRIGPGVRYTLQSGDIQADRRSIGPTLVADYRLSSKVTLNGEVGMDFVSYSGPNGISDEFVHVRLGASYVPNPLWVVELSVFRDAQANPSLAGAYREILSTRFNVAHKIRRATVSVGLTYETNSNVYANGAPGPSQDREYLMLESSVSMPIFGGRSTAMLFYHWRDEQRDGGGSWEGSQLGLSVTTRF